MYRNRYNGPSGRGLGIFWLMLIFLPVIGFIFICLNWILNHIGLIIFIGVVISFIILCLVYKYDSKQEERDV